MNEYLRSWEGARRVLCVRLDSMGDVLMTGPALRALKEQVPGRQITLLTSRAGAEAGRHIPEVDGVIEYAAPWMKSTAEAADRTALIEELRRRNFDAAVIFGLHTQSPLPAALVCWLAGIPLLAGRCRENPYQLLTTWLAEDEATGARRHDVERQLSLVEAVGATTLDDPSPASTIADTRYSPRSWLVERSDGTRCRPAR